MMNKIRISFISTGNIRQASTRFRVMQFLPYFKQLEYIDILGFVTINTKKSYLKIVQNLFILIKQSLKSDIIFIHKARLPAALIWIISRLSKIIYDFDDAVFSPPPSWGKTEDTFIKRRKRLNYILKYANLVIAGNDYLASYARKHAKEVVVIQTVVDTGIISLHSDISEFRQIFDRAPKISISSQLTIGWIGGSEHVKQLNSIGDVLKNLQKQYDIEIKVVSGREWKYPDIIVSNKRWSLDDEVKDVQSFDIGIMPLENTPFLRGKCGFKAIEYMALGIPAVVSPVGVNPKIVRHGVCGFLANEPEDWYKYLSMLIENKELRIRLGKQARKHVEKNFSVYSVLNLYLSMFRQISGNYNLHSADCEEQ